MKKQFQHLKLFFPALLLLIALSSIAQQQFIHTATKENSYCNSNCTTLDVPELNNNPAAIIWAIPILEDGVNLNPHPIGVYYFQNQWRIFNLDQKALPEGSKFNVQYSTKPDATHFKYSITNENIRKDGSAYIDHSALTNNPAIQFVLFPSWIPVDGGAANRYEIKLQYDSDARKWFIKNINERYLYARVAYNIIISNPGNSVAGPVKGNPDISIKNPTIITNSPGIIIPEIDKPVVKPNSTGIIIPDFDKPVVKPNSPGIIIPEIDKPLDKKGIITKTSIPPSYDFSNVHICIEKASANSLPPKAPYTPYPIIPKIKSNGELEPISTVTQPLSGITNSMWTPGESIRVGFLDDASFIMKRKVKQYVKEWETYANIHFVFINDPPNDITKAQIVVGFQDNGLDWSWIGREASRNSTGEKTMNLGSIWDNTEESEIRRVVLHQFGHVLGFIDEHKAPTAGIPWDRDKVFSFFAASPRNWSAGRVNEEIFSTYSQTKINSSTYDRLSIMHFFFPPELTTDGSSFIKNTNLSETDKAFAKQVYPFPPTPTTATGVLETGDDCDEIEFTIEYNVVHSSEVEFILLPGRDHHNALVNWWKMIGIPQSSTHYNTLELNTTLRIKVEDIYKTKPITFAKAKVLGVHTNLPYTWKPWAAVPGGCRVKFVWRRDSCN